MKEMKLYKVLGLLVITALLTGCFSDDTSFGGNPISEIAIDSTSISNVYNINRNDTLIISPRFVQSYENKEISYAWEMNQKVVSTEPVFTFIGNALGSYDCRLIISNEDGKTFFLFKLNVNSPYEEGFTIVSRDPNGKSRLSFMLTPTDENVEAKFYDYDCFELNNPDYKFASNVADMAHTNGSLIIACQGKLGEGDTIQAGGSDIASIYYLNDKTFIIENIVTAPEFPLFVPTRLHIPSVGLAGASYPILTKSGKIYEFSSTEGAIARPRNLKWTYAPASFLYDHGGGTRYTITFWDREKDALCEIINGYGPYFCSKTYLLTRDNCTPETNYFEGREYIQAVNIERTREQVANSIQQMLVLTKTGIITQKTQMDVGFWRYDYDTQENSLGDNGGPQTVGFNVKDFNEHTPCIANQTYWSMLYGVGNQVKKWNFTSSQMLSASTVLQTIGSESAIITDFTISDDHKKTYVAFYEPNQTGLNGSVWVINTDNGTILKKYDNICYQPVKIIYKKK